METGERVEPDSPNATKLEMFIFDVFPRSETMAVLNVPRASEFTPVKNAPGDQRTPAGNILAGDATNDTIYAPTSAANGSLAPTSGTGGNMSFNIRSPFLSLSYQIALYGIYPSRS